MTTDTMISPSEAARIAGVSAPTIVRLCDSGKIAGVKTALGRLVDPVSVELYARERARVSLNR